MFRFFARPWAKLRYIWRLETQAGETEINSKLAALNARLKRESVEKLNADADEIEANIKRLTELEEKGYFLCESGHVGDSVHDSGAKPDVATWICLQCGSPAKFIKRSEMNGQEQYESDKERRDAEKIVENKRQQAKVEAESISDIEKAAQGFRQQVDMNRVAADKIRRL